jgi:GNAT superfamily N-acetyltransferase
MTYLPALHTAAEDIEFFSGVVDAHGTDGRVVDVAESVSSTGGEVIGFSAVHHDWLDHLYVAPGWQGRGVGSALLARAQVVRPDRLILWVFEANERARAFYRRAGFIEMERTDGRDNMEKVPDVLMRWTGATS